jgi:hypothetical protein
MSAIPYALAQGQAQMDLNPTRSRRLSHRIPAVRNDYLNFLKKRKYQEVKREKAVR